MALEPIRLGLKFIHIDDGFSKRARCFLRQIVPDSAFDGPMLIFAREFLRIGAGLRVRCTVGITFEGDRRHGDDRRFGKPIFQIVVVFLPFSETEPPAVIMDYDADVIRIVERRRRSGESGVVEFPFR